MKICTFFGHRDAPREVESALRRVLTELIEREQVTEFYVGNHGEFDRLVYRVLTEWEAVYPHIRCTVVLAYLPEKPMDYRRTVVAEGVETVPKRLAIVYRNRWMADRAQYVVTAVNRSWGGAAQSKAYCARQGKRIIELLA